MAQAVRHNPLKRLGAALLALIVAGGLWLGPGPVGSPAAEAQLTSTGPSSQIPPGRRLTREMVRQELERRLARNPANEAAIWNTGYDFFRHYPQNQDTARAIKEGFLLARRSAAPAQREILFKGAVYWEKIHDYGISNVPAGQDRELVQRRYHGEPARKMSTLPRRQPGSAHQGFKDYDWPGRRLNQGPPAQGRPDNPYPGKYYQGMYPP